MGRKSTIWLGTPREEAFRDDKLNELRSVILPEGDSVRFDAKLDSGLDIHVRATLEEVAQISHIVRGASAALINRQARRVNRGSDKFLELATGALRPVRHDMFADPYTDDLLFVFQFPHDAPFALRVNLEECMENMARTVVMMRRAAN